MRKTRMAIALICLLLVQAEARSQTQDPPRYEVAAELTTINREEIGTTRVEPGLGVRFTFNLNKNFAIEGAAHASFNSCSRCRNAGQVYDAFAGIKAGKRFQSWGIFAKARPGVVSFGQGKIDIIPTGASGPFPFEFRATGLDNFATDLGGVVEFYPSRRIVTRFDAGDTIIHFTRRMSNGLSYDPTSGTFTIIPFITPSRTTHNFQFMASVGFRF